ncbi:MAG TPA: efflux RND transporter periplasmic adaptor subunit [Puia sp.]|nr:efflux RND transporter periplasmic adaptor subunit [Puia sp.]
MENITRWTGLMIIVSGLMACGNDKPAGPATPPPVAVGVSTAAPGDATYYDEYPATVAALNQVDIKPQVSGNITHIYFQDGQHVQKGAPLYEIDQQQYKAQYEAAVANLNVAKANLARSQQDADRYTDLSQKDAIAKQTLDHALADLEANKRQVEAAQANVASVQTNLKYSTIYAPFDGTIGISQVKLGTAVYPQTLLNTVSSDNPLAVDVAVDEKQIARFSTLLQQRPAAGDSTFTFVQPDGSVYPFPGHILLLDRAVDPTTGTIKARLTFPNPKNALRPGVTGNVRVQNKGAVGSILIPFKSVVEQMGEYFVFVVGDSSKVAQRKVQLGARVGDKIVARDGVQAGEKVVTEGVQKIRDGAKVQIGTPGAKPPAQAGAPQGK